MSKAETNLKHEASFGKTPTTLVRLRISLLILSRLLVVRIILRCSKGKSKNENPSERLSSSHADRRGTETAYFWMAACSNSSAVFRSGALNIERMSAATSNLMCCLGKYAPAFCCKWNWHLCQGTLPNTARLAAPRPLIALVSQPRAPSDL